MPSSRVKNTRRNIAVSYAAAGITMLFQFVSRTAIKQVLGADYLGLSSLVMSVLGVLNLAELGFSGAVVYNLYGPIARGDDDAVCAILAYYRRVYRMIGCVIAAAGLACMPFLPALIRGGVPQGVNIYLVYALYLANTVVSYLSYAYMSTLLIALQRVDLTKVALLAVSVLQYSLQLAALYVARSYYLFAAAMVAGTVAQNVATYLVARRRFPQYVCRGEISAGARADIMSRVKGIMVGRISSVSYSTFDSVILSATMGLAAVAAYNNYITIYSGVTNLVSMLRSAMDASVGNSVAGETVEKNHRDLRVWQLVFSVIAAVGSSCMLCVFQPFMELWMDPDMLLPLRDVVLICLWFFSTTTSHAFFLYLSGTGMWWELRWCYIGSTVANLLLNLMLGSLLGTTGVLISSVAVGVVFGWVWQSRIIFREYFGRSPAGYYARQLALLGVAAASCAAALALCEALPLAALGLVPVIAARVVLAAAVPLAAFVLLFRGTEEYARAKQMLIGR